MIFLDMDGVLCDFAKRAREWVEIDSENPDPNSLTDVYRAMSPNAFWDSLDEDFWSNMEFLDFGEELVELLWGGGFKFMILSSPTDGRCLKGKYSWIKQHLGSRITGSRDFIFTPHKYLFAQRGRVLVDDHESHIKKWNDNGGTGIHYTGQSATEVFHQVKGYAWN